MTERDKELIDLKKLVKALKRENRKLKSAENKRLTEEKRRKTLKQLQSKLYYQKTKLRKQKEFAIQGVNVLNLNAKVADFEATVTFPRLKGTIQEKIKTSRQRLKDVKPLVKEQYKKNIVVILSKLSEKLKRTADSLEKKAATKEEVKEFIEQLKQEQELIINNANSTRVKYFNELFTKSAKLYDEYIKRLTVFLSNMPE